MMHRELRSGVLPPCVVLYMPLSPCILEARGVEAPRSLRHFVHEFQLPRAHTARYRLLFRVTAGVSLSQPLVISLSDALREVP